MPSMQRETPRAGHWSDVLLDLRQAWRGMRRHPALVVVLIVVLGLGIGTATATWSLVDALLLRPLPVHAPQDLVIVGDPTRTNSSTSGGPRVDLISYPLFSDIRNAVPQLSAIAASSRVGRIDVLIRDSGSNAIPAAEHPNGRLVSANYFATLGVGAAVGHTFPSSQDVAPGDDPSIVISDRYWRERFGADSSVIGRSITINHVPLVIVGVMPRGFDGEIVGTPTAIWIPIMMEPSLIPARPWIADRNTSSLLLIGRLAPGATLEQARTTLNTVAHRAIQEHATAAEWAAQTARDPVPVSIGARGVSTARGLYGQALSTLMIAVAALLLLALANAANLSLARAVASTQDTTVRTALGAGRSRLLRQSLIEHLLIGAVAGVVGIALGVWGAGVLLGRADPLHDTLLLDVKLNQRVAIFAVLVSAVTALLFGIVPTAWQMLRNPSDALRGAGRGMARGWSVGARALVVVQVALSIVLIAATATLRTSLLRTEAIDAGFARGGLVVTTVDLARSGYSAADRPAIMQRLMTTVRSAPGVQAASYNVNGMFSGAEADTTLQAEGFVPRTANDTVVKCDYVGPGFFHAIGARLIQGRDIEERDDQNAPKVAVVNQSFAHFYFGAASAVGKHLILGANSYEVIGVVADLQSQRLRDPAPRRLYTPVAQRYNPPGYITFASRGTDPARIVDPIRKALMSEAPALIILINRPVDDVIAGTMVQDRLLADVVSFFGLLALLLAGLGIYGVIANATARRTREFGVRMALGAQRGGVLRMVVFDALRLVCYGIVLGIPMIMLAAPLLGKQLFGVAPVDPVSIGLAVIVMLVVAGIAAAIPAGRAAGLQPVEALK